MDFPAAGGGEHGGVPPDPTEGGDASPQAPRAGRHGNGLSAPTYAVLAQCEPQIADAVLGTLAAEGIAAYAVPYAGRVGGYLEAYPPDRPLARVWVDSSVVHAARDVLAERYQVSAEPPAVAEDAAWRDIVAGLRRPGPDGPVPWPAAEDLATPRSSSAPGSDAAGLPPIRMIGMPPPAAPRSVQPGPRTSETASGPGGPAEPADEHFVPPPPPPVPVPTGAMAYGIAALIGGFAVLLVPTMAGDPVGPALLVLAIVAIVGGFGTLVARMRAGPPTQDDPDDGAVL